MSTQTLRNLLENSNDRLSIFASFETLRQYKFNTKELLTLINDFLSDEEKLKLFDYSHFQQLKSPVKLSILGLVSDENIKLQMLCNDSIANSLDTSQVVELAKGLSSEEAKRKIIRTYQLEDYWQMAIINTFSSSGKLDSLLSEECSLSESNKISLLCSLDVSTLSKLLLEHKEFLSKNRIRPYEIINKLDAKRQKDFVANLEHLNLTLDEKRETLATLKPAVKQNIDTASLPEEYKVALSMQTAEYSGRIILDFDRNLEDYRGLDNLMRINPEEFTQEQRAKLMQLCDICPSLLVISSLNSVESFSTAKQYQQAEAWISSILDNLNPEYSKAQKMAVIDHAIGRKISYTPEVDTEAFDMYGSRALWKIISSGYGVCNGNAKVEQYMLKRIGIESELISSGTHVFLKIKDIELPLANGEIVKGNTILDPTWNLTSHRFGAIPDNFCISYAQARQNDIDIDGKDHHCHRNDEKLQDATLSLDEQSLRQLFTSVGLADKDGQFPIKDLLEKSKSAHEIYANQPEKDIHEQFFLLSQACPEFATCQNSSMSVLGNLLTSESLKFNRCIINRVYRRTDKEKKANLFVYIDSDELGKKFYFADKDKGQFVELPQEEFTKQFECYEEDLKNYNRA